MKTFLPALLVLTIATPAAFAQTSEKERDNARRLYRQVEQLKTVIEKLKHEAASERDKAVHQRKLADQLKKLYGAGRVQIRVEKNSDKPRIHKDESGNEKVRIIRVRVRKGDQETEDEYRIRGGEDKREMAMKHAMERLEHMGIAIKHLKAAGMNDLAEAVAKRAGAYKKELAMLKNRGNHHHAKGGVSPHHLREISEAIMQLRKQVLGLQKAVERLERRK